jgi:cytochrome b561
MAEHAQNRATHTGESADLARYGRVARLMHWVVALFVIIQVPVGVAMTTAPLSAWADPLFILHKGLGAILLVLVVGRILWRVSHAPPELSDDLHPTEKRIAHRTHLAIYAALLTMVVSGYVRTVGDGYPIELLDLLGIPPLVPLLPGLAAAMLVVHRFAVFILVVLVAVHVAAVLRHALIEKDRVLQRMWPPW